MKEQAFQGIKWKFFESSSLQVLGFLFSVILSRFLGPEEFGLMALTGIFFAIAGTLRTMGFGTALIRKSDRSHEDYCTVFWYNIVVSAIMAIILALCAPLFAQWFDHPELIGITYCTSVFMFLGSISSIHQTIFICDKNFKTPAIINSITTVIGIPVCLTAAYMGCSYWSFIIQSAVTMVTSGILLWVYSPWRPQFIFSKKSFKELFSFGSKLVGLQFIDIIYDHSRGLLIGSLYRVASLAIYNRSLKVASLAAGIPNGVFGTVMLPILTDLQHDHDALITAYRKYMRVSSLAIYFVQSLLLALAYPVIIVVYTETWVECAGFLQILLLGWMGFHYGSLNHTLLTIKGRGDVLLTMATINKIISFAILIPAAFHSVEAICWASPLYVPFGLVINGYYSRKYYGLTAAKQARDLLPYLGLSLASCTPAYLLTLTDLNPYIQLIAGGSIAIILYAGVLHLCKDEAFYSVLGILDKKGLFTPFKKIAALFSRP